MPIEYFLALRFMREGRAQTALILGGVAVGVAVIVFLSSLIGGLQTTIIERTLGSQPHITVYPRDEEAREVIARDDPNTVVVSRIERPAQRVRSIAEWQRLLRRLRRDSGITAATAVVAGPAFVTRGQSSNAVRVFGVEADDFNRIIPVRKYIVDGAYQPSAGNVLLGVTLATELGVGVKDRVRIETARGTTQMFVVSGLFQMGSKVADEQWAIVSLRAGQALLALPGGASDVYVRVADLYDAEQVASRIRSSTHLAADSWMASNAQLLTALRSQSASSFMIEFFIVLAVAMGIASVLIVSVVQRSRAIGILRAMGVQRARVLRLFLFQGAIYGALGSVLGSAMGIGLIVFFTRVAAPLFPIEFSAWHVLLACGLAVLTGVSSAALPARQASKLDPAVAIRNV